MDALNPHGQWMNDQVKLALFDIAKQLEIPDGYTLSIDDYQLRKPFLAGDLNTCNDLSKRAKNPFVQGGDG